jgi:hypothetical protein
MASPVCNISVNEPITQPDPPDFPAIPLATDLSSAIDAINSMAQGYRILTGQQGTAGQNGKAGTAGSQGKLGQTGKQGPTGPMGPPG